MDFYSNGEHRYPTRTQRSHYLREIVQGRAGWAPIPPHPGDDVPFEGFHQDVNGHYPLFLAMTLNDYDVPVVTVYWGEDAYGVTGNPWAVRRLLDVLEPLV